MQRSLIIAVLLLGARLVSAHDWPAYRGDAARSGYTTEQLPAAVAPLWTHRPVHAPQPAWPRDERMDFDRGYQVVIAQGRLLYGSSADCAVHCLATDTGAELWSFTADAPIRFAPAVWRDRLFAVSDDGYLYCLQAGDGTLIRKWRGGPDETRVLGNERMISRWPARGGPVVLGDTVYWAAGIWQSEGVFVYAVNAETGKVLWQNGDSNRIRMPQPHPGAEALSGVTAQGYLLADDDQLFVPTGRAVPAAFQRADGKFQYYRLQENQQRGGTTAMVAGSFLYNGGVAYNTSTGLVSTTRLDGQLCSYPDGILQGTVDRLRAHRIAVKQVADRKGKPTSQVVHELSWELDAVPSGAALVIAGNTAVSAADKRLALVDLEARRVLTTHIAEADVCGLAVAEGRLFVSLANGVLCCFGPARAENPAKDADQAAEAPLAADPAIAKAAHEILQSSGISDGYCADLGCGDGALALELARQSRLHIVAIDSDASAVAAARRKLSQAGYYGVRVTVLYGDPRQTRFPKYFANLVVSQRSLQEGADAVDEAESLRLRRPYGGVCCLGKPGEWQLSRRGPLDKAGEWTHLYCDPSNTLCSTDEVSGPLHVLWFRDVDWGLPQRHGRGPAPLFREGRLFVEGSDGIIAVDAYNGRPLWHFDLPAVLQAYNADHLAGTAVTGSNFCLGADSLFVRRGDRCYRLNAADGKVLATYLTPPHKANKPGDWGYLAYADGVLYGSLANQEHIVRHAYKPADAEMQLQYSESSSLFAINVESGALLWRYDAQQSIRHNAVAIGGGRVYLIDRALAEGDRLLTSQDQRRGTASAAKKDHPLGTLVCLDAKKGTTIWSSKPEAFGTMLIYSEPRDLLLSCYQATRFKLPSERGGRMAVYRAADGDLVWDREINYATRPLLNDRTILAYPVSIDLLSGESTSLDFIKSYGCGQLAGSKHLLLFRSATLGYYDLERQGGTENFGGIRPGCWINVLPAGGLILFPDASSGCRCSYQNRAWMALEGS